MRIAIKNETRPTSSRVSTVLDGGSTLAVLVYTGPDLTGVSYPAGTGKAGNGTSLARGVDGTGATGSLRWAFTSGNALTDAVVRSQTGRVLTDTVTDGSAVASSAYTYDGAGRLTRAVVPGHTLGYGFASTGGCGASTRAGADGNRTMYTDTPPTGTATSTVYCYDNADRLTATTVTNPVSGANPVVGTSLSSTGTSPTLVYDGDGAMTTLADEVSVFDPAGRHMSTTTTGGTYERYLRDATDRIVQRDAHATGTTTARLGYTGPGDSSDLVLSTTNKITQRQIALPGGVVESLIVYLPTTGRYGFTTTADDGIRIWVDDILTLDNQAAGTMSVTTPRTLTAGPHRIRVDYTNTGGAASLHVSWTVPGASTPVGVPAGALAPDYNLVTRTDSDDTTAPAAHQTTSYGAAPWLGLPTATTEDPDGLRLTTTTTYEAVGAGWLRATGRFLPMTPTTSPKGRIR